MQLHVMRREAEDHNDILLRILSSAEERIDQQSQILIDASKAISSTINQFKIIQQNLLERVRGRGDFESLRRFEIEDLRMRRNQRDTRQAAIQPYPCMNEHINKHLLKRMKKEPETKVFSIPF